MALDIYRDANHGIEFISMDLPLLETGKLFGLNLLFVTSSFTEAGPSERTWYIIPPSFSLINRIM